MRIKNATLAGAKMRLRSSGETVTGDANGCFEMPEADAKILLDTPGWSTVKAARPLEDAPEPVASTPKPSPAPVPPKATEPTPEPPRPTQPDPTEGLSEEEEEEEGPDLDSMSKAQLLEVANEYGVEVSSRWSEARLRETLEKAIYGEEEEA